MSSYYGVTRSSEYLAHYGIKGMKWGVRRAIERGSERALDRQWAKANRKLNRLNKKANIEKQLIRNRKLASLTAQTAIGGGAGGVAGVGAATNTLKNTTKRIGLGAVGALGGAALASAVPAVLSYKTRKRLMPEGHQKAVNNAQAWAKEMNRAFHKTKYQGKTKPFNDTYITKTARYLPEEARRGNARPYEVMIRATTGNQLAKQYADSVRRKRRRS